MSSAYINSESKTISFWKIAKTRRVFDIDGVVITKKADLRMVCINFFTSDI